MQRSIFFTHPVNRWAFGAVALVALALPLAAQPKYIVFDIGTLGGSSAAPHAINNAGQVAGSSSLATGETRGFHTAPNSPIDPATDAVPTLGGTVSFASSINNSGQVAGAASDASGAFLAIRLDTDGSMYNLGFLGGSSASSNANAINDSGQVTGTADGPIPPFGPPCFGTGGLYAFRTAANAVINPNTDNLGTLLGRCRYSVGFGINNVGQVVGDSAAVSVFNPVQHAMLATPGSPMKDLGVLGGVSLPIAVQGINATASAINNSGQIVGRSTYNHGPAVPYYVQHAFLTTATGPMQDLGTLGGTSSAANAINALGQIVGNTTLTGDTAVHAFLYSAGVMTDVNSFIPAGTGWVLQNATGINDNGQIVGTGLLNGNFRGYRADPFDIAIQGLIAELSSPALGLSKGQIDSLSAKLDAALKSIQNGKSTPAANQLGAFINEVQADAQTGKISAANAAQLIAIANAIIASL